MCRSRRRCKTSTQPSIKIDRALRFGGILELRSIPSKCLPQRSTPITNGVLMVLYFSSVANKLESANHFANCEKTQHLTRDYACRYQLLPVDVSDPTENALQGYRVCGILSYAEESCWVPNDVQQSRKV